MVEPESLKQYFERARRWEYEELRAAIRSKRLAWTVACVASVGMIVSIGAVAALAPLKTVEPFIVRVDNTTGIVDTVASLKDAPVTADEAMSRYFLAKYVRARQGYSRATIERNYDIVSTMSTAPVQEAYARWISGQNAGSPQNVYGGRGTVTISIKAIQLINPGLASVRYMETAHYEQSVSTTHWIATIAYEFLPDEELTIRQRLINPLAFAVTEYRNDPEVVE